jgi:hypothetical protein
MGTKREKGKMKSYLFLLLTRNGSDTFSLREVPPQYRIAASGLRVGEKMAVPAGALMSLDAGRDIPAGDVAALWEAEIGESASIAIG